MYSRFTDAGRRPYSLLAQKEAASLLPDEYVRKMAFAGNQAHAVRHIASLVDAGVDSISVFPLGRARTETVRAFAASVEEYLG